MGSHSPEPLQGERRAGDTLREVTGAIASRLTLRFKLFEPPQVVPVHALDGRGGPRADAGDELLQLPRGGIQVHVRSVRISQLLRGKLCFGISGRLQVAFFFVCRFKPGGGEAGLINVITRPESFQIPFLRRLSRRLEVVQLGMRELVMELGHWDMPEGRCAALCPLPPGIFIITSRLFFLLEVLTS